MPLNGGRGDMKVDLDCWFYKPGPYYLVCVVMGRLGDESRKGGGWPKGVATGRETSQRGGT